MQLRSTVARYNRFAETGVDVDFAKGETELNRFNGDAGHKPNPCIGPIAAAPFYALAVWPADIAVSTGLATDADARVLAERRQADPRPLCLRQRSGLRHGGQLSGPRHDARPGDGVCMARGDARAGSTNNTLTLQSNSITRSGTMAHVPKNLFADMLERVRAATAPLVGAADLSRIVVEPPRDPTHGDMATNAAMVFAKELKKIQKSWLLRLPQRWPMTRPWPKLTLREQASSI